MTINYPPEQINTIIQESSFSFDEKGRLLIFVGHAHSGHSLVGALLDAHPDVCLANEVNVVKLMHDQQLTQNAVEQVLFHAYEDNQKGWKNSEYIYNLNHASQGRSLAPVVLGDKKAGGSTRIVHNHPSVFKRLMKMYASRLRIIYVERNPVDIIAAYAYYMKQTPSEFHVNRYNENKKTVEWMKNLMPAEQWLTIKQDVFVKFPFQEIMQAFTFLGVDTAGLEGDIKQWVSVVRSDIKGKSESIPIGVELQAQIL